MTSTKPIRAVSFDATGTLLRVAGGVGSRYARTLEAWGVAANADALEAAFRRAWADAKPPPFTGVPRPDDDRGWWKGLFHATLHAAGIAAGAQVDACFEDAYTDFARPGAWELFPETAEALDRIGARYPMVVTSNFDRRLRRVLEGLSLLDRFDAVILSSEHGADKPHPHLFRRACEAAGVAPAQFFHIGDDPACDGEGARRAGLRHFVIRRPHTTLLDACAALGC